MDIFQTIAISTASGLIGGFISYYFAQKTETYKSLQLQKQKAEAVARLFARWIKYRGKEREYLNEKEQSDYFEDLNRMAFELSFWITDQELLTDIMRRLQNAPDAKDIRVIIGEVRKMILDNPNDQFNSQEITIWPK